MIDTWMIAGCFFSAGTAFGCWWKSLVAHGRLIECRDMLDSCLYRERSLHDMLLECEEEEDAFRAEIEALKLVNQALHDELSVLVGEKKRASSSALRQEPTGAFMLRTEPEDGLGPNGFQSPSEGVGG